MPIIKMLPVPKDGVRPQDVYPLSEDFKDDVLGRGTGDIDFVCGHCGAVVFASTLPGQIDGAGVIPCPKCRNYNRFPIRTAVAHPLDPFESPKLSLKWAKEHIEDFHRNLKGFIESKPYSFAVEVDPNTGEYIHKIKLRRQLPDRLRRTARDAIQGLRATLDHTMFVIAKEDRYFPFRGDADAFKNCLSEKFGDFPPEIVDVLRAAQPYKGGNDILWAMNRACNPNKHGLIRPIGTVIGGIEISGPGTLETLLVFQPKWDGTKNEMVFARMMPGDSNSPPNLKIAFDVGIGDVPFIEGKPALAVLYDLSQMVEGILVTIEAEAIRLKLV
jgi:hypothetical protein